MFVANPSQSYRLSHATAILIFARPVAADAARKRIASQSLVGRQVLTRLNQRVSQTAGATNLPVLHSAELITHRASFGQQLTEALRATFALGYERVLVIGNDCPALTTAHLTQAADQLRSAPVVLGPDRRGGLYLLGLSREVFEQVSLLSLPWQTNRLGRAVYRACATWSIASLPRLGDINNRADLRQYRATAPIVALFITSLRRLETGEPSPAGNPQFIRVSDAHAGGCGSLRAPPASQATAIAA